MLSVTKELPKVIIEREASRTGRTLGTGCIVETSDSGN